ncbi:hypothetical protein LWC34_36560 [Kibdelosporangium philippinense]|uniref:Uncharacterized protein n=1 Tax=Kibdelosporangium philippinense TaxID=211113 RepID=A0ABS8ZKF4_9PSEU|nr:hypothetical protein [Kibdelosporangium philippinense]MCE7008288.1 hypothetical protein [Kibdelosporangium philippinense]
MHVNWTALGSVFLVSVVVTLLVSVLFAVGIVAQGRGKPVLAIGSFAICGVVTLLGIAVILA